MLNSVTRNLIILIFVLSPIANAELWVKHDNGTIQSKFHGDCFKAGFCGKNNTNLLTGWIEVDSTEYANASNKYYKVSGGEVVEMTQQEKDDLDAEEAQAQIDANLARAEKLGFEVEDVIIALVKRINVRIPSNPITKAEVVKQLKDDKGI